MEDGKQYYAFISYKRADEKWAKWLQEKLEHYRFPTNLNGRTDLPKNIRPTFRDVTDITPGLLSEEITKALINSEWLIVVCSLRSAKSPWVSKESQTFIDLGRADHIIPFIIDGIPFSGCESTECFPESLRNLTETRELIAANINEMGADAALVKVVARMFYLQFDVLWQRFQREQAKRRKMVIAGLIIIIMTVVGISMWIGSQNTKIKDQNKELDQRYKIINEQKEELRKNKEQIQSQLEILTIQRDSLSDLVCELNIKNFLLAQANDSLIKQKTAIINYTHEIKTLKNENEKLKQQIYIDVKKEINVNNIEFGL